MRADSAVSLDLFYATIKQRVIRQLQLIDTIAVFANVNHQLQALDSEMSLIKDTCAYELIRFVECAKNYPEKLEQVSWTRAVFNSRVDVLCRLINRCVDKVTLLNKKINSSFELNAMTGHVLSVLNQIERMVSANVSVGMSDNRYRLIGLPVPKTVKCVMSDEVIVVSGDVAVDGSAVMGVVCMEDSHHNNK